MNRAESVALVREFNELRRFFSVYLLEDCYEEYGSPEGALLAFKAESSESELALAGAQLRELLGAGLSEPELDDVIVWGLLSRISPPVGEIADWLRAVLETLERPLGDDDGVYTIDDVVVWLEQESSVHIKAVTRTGDPVELSPRYARRLADILSRLADRADA